MIICSCNVISDKDLLSKLDKVEKGLKPGELYCIMSGGKKPQCAKCMGHFKEILDDRH